VEKTWWWGQQWSTDLSKEAETCFVLPLRETVAHFARRKTRPTDTEMGSSDNGDTHARIDMAQSFSHFSASMADSFLSKILASLPRRPPPLHAPNGEKCRRCSRQAPRCFFFSSRWLGLPIGLGVDIRNPNINDNLAFLMRQSAQGNLVLILLTKFPAGIQS
jgi:hypothetical protein